MRGVRGVASPLLGLVLLVAATACGVLELGGSEHRAVVVETAQVAEAERWSLVAELLATEIAATSVIELSFTAGDVACEDGTPVEPGELVLGREFRFEQQGTVEGAEPPRVEGVDLVVTCD